MSKQKVIGPKAELFVDLDSKVLCAYCNRVLRVSVIGQHFSSICKGALRAKGKDLNHVEEKKENAKKKRNNELKEKRKSWEYKYKEALKRWEKLLPPKIRSRFLPVSRNNPFFWTPRDPHLKEDVFTKSEREKFGNFLFPQFSVFVDQFSKKLNRSREDDEDRKILDCFTRAMNLSLSKTLHPDKGKYS